MHIGVSSIKIISRLPWRVLYMFSTLIYWLIFRIIGYRKDTVRTNLHKSFPNQTRSQIHEISNDYFKYLADLIIESIKSITMSEKDWLDGFKVENIELPNAYFDKGQSIIIVLGHYGNWEYMVTALSKYSKHTILGVYKPLSNPHFEALLASYRTRYGMVLVPHYDAYEIIKKHTVAGEKVAILLIGDQTPAINRGYWMDFLHQDTPVFRGTEKLAKSYNFPILFAELDLVKRGKYIMTFEPLFMRPKETQEGEITEAHTKKLEQQIIQKPYLWLWSHKRWKHIRPANTPIRFISKRFPSNNSPST